MFLFSLIRYNMILEVEIAEGDETITIENVEDVIDDDSPLPWN